MYLDSYARSIPYWSMEFHEPYIGKIQTECSYGRVGAREEITGDSRMNHGKENKYIGVFTLKKMICGKHRKMHE